MKKPQQQKGFTLIELIIVIIILGILSVTAAPRFLDLTNDARESTVEGVLGAVRAASQIGRSAFLVRGVTDNQTIEGVVVSPVNGYPSAGDMCDLVGLTEGADDTAGTEGDDIEGDGFMCEVTGTNPATLTITAEDAANGATCNVTYEEAGADSPPVIDSNVTNCA